MTEESDDLSGLKVMVSDDSKTIRSTAENLLTKEGCEVVTAVDGFEALSKIAEHKPDIIFVDIMMPRLDGYQTCALIKLIGYSKRHRSLCCPVKTVFLTGRVGGLWVRSSI